MKNGKKYSHGFFPAGIVFIIIMSTLVSVGTLFGAYYFHIPQDRIIKIIFWNIEYFFVFILSLEINGYQKILEGKKRIIAVLFFLLPFIMVLISRDILILNFWMIGQILATVYIHLYVGLSYHLVLTLTFCMVNGYGIDYFIGYFIVGALIIVISCYMDKLLNVLFLQLVVIVVNITALFVINQFQISSLLNNLYELVSTVLVMFFVYGVLKNCSHHQSEVIQETMEIEGKEKKSYHEEKLIMEEIEEFSADLYFHSMHIGMLSSGAAKIVQGNEELARIGGYYHEYGRIFGGNYIESGVKMLRKHKIPEEVISVVEQHSVKYMVPQSKEAVAVLLSDSIITSIKYLENKNSNGVSNADKIIQSVFTKRTDEHIFEKVGLTEEEMVKMKQYYLDNWRVGYDHSYRI